MFASNTFGQSPHQATMMKLMKWCCPILLWSWCLQFRWTNATTGTACLLVIKWLHFTGTVDACEMRGYVQQSGSSARYAFPLCSPQLRIAVIFWSGSMVNLTSVSGWRSIIAKVQVVKIRSDVHKNDAKWVTVRYAGNDRNVFWRIWNLEDTARTMRILSYLVILATFVKLTDSPWRSQEVQPMKVHEKSMNPSIHSCKKDKKIKKSIHQAIGNLWGPGTASFFAENTHLHHFAHLHLFVQHQAAATYLRWHFSMPKSIILIWNH